MSNVTEYDTLEGLWTAINLNVYMYRITRLYHDVSLRLAESTTCNSRLVLVSVNFRLLVEDGNRTLVTIRLLQGCSHWTCCQHTFNRY